MIAVVVSMATGCLYCLVAHGAALRQAWGDPVMADRITLDWRRADALTERQRAICALAGKARRAPAGWEGGGARSSAGRRTSTRCARTGCPTRTCGTSSRWRRCTTSRTASRRRAGRSRTPSTTRSRARPDPSADRAPAELDRLLGVRARDEVRAGRDDAALL